MRCGTGQQVVNFVKVLAQGGQLNIEGNAVTLICYKMTNNFNTDALHPTRLRTYNCEVQIITSELPSPLAVQLQVVHTDMLDV